MYKNLLNFHIGITIYIVIRVMCIIIDYICYGQSLHGPGIMVLPDYDGQCR